ncbi:hypothetical protein GC175_14010 [bacterium]|nr:hypothetical protein [bacterium]
MDPLTSVARWFWILFVLVNLLNYVIAGRRARHLAGDDPQRQAWYARILRVYFGALCILFLIMGVGIVFGGVPTVFHYFRPQDGNPYVLLFFAANIVLYALAVYWIFLRNGAEQLAAHPGAIMQLKDPRQIKLVALLALVGGIAALVMITRLDFPVDAFFKLPEG